MLNDAKWMTEEEFVEVYPCTLEVEVNGRVRELVPGGSDIPLTKLNVEQYIQVAILTGDIVIYNVDIFI